MFLYFLTSLYFWDDFSVGFDATQHHGIHMQCGRNERGLLDPVYHTKSLQ